MSRSGGRMSTKSVHLCKRQKGSGVMRCILKRVLFIAVLLDLTTPVWAQTDSETMQGMDAGSMQDMDHSSMSGMENDSSQSPSKDAEQDTHPSGSMPGMDHSTMSGMEHGTTMQMNDNNMNMSGMSMEHGSMQGGTAPADARDPNAYSGGYTLDSGPYTLPGPRQLRMADEHNFGSLLVDRLEAVRTSDNTSAAYDILAWYGRDYDRAVLKSEGDYDNGAMEEASTELLWGHAITAYWNSELGLRYDSGEGPNRTWLAFGVQGLAPYWFETNATGYIGQDGRSAMKLEAEYEMLFTQKLILQPRIEADIYGKDDTERGTGSGLSQVTAGLRLRYEIRREFAPYVGIEWAGLFSKTADFARAAGLDSKKTRVVAGIRFWF